MWAMGMESKAIAATVVAEDAVERGLLDRLQRSNAPLRLLALIMWPMY